MAAVENEQATWWRWRRREFLGCKLRVGIRSSKFASKWNWWGQLAHKVRSSNSNSKLVFGSIADFSGVYSVNNVKFEILI